MAPPKPGQQGPPGGRKTSLCPATQHNPFDSSYQSLAGKEAGLRGGDTSQPQQSVLPRAALEAGSLLACGGLHVNWRLISQVCTMGGNSPVPPIGILNAAQTLVTAHSLVSLRMQAHCIGLSNGSTTDIYRPPGSVLTSPKAEIMLRALPR